MKNLDYSNNIRSDDDVQSEFEGILVDIAKNTDAENIILKGNGLASSQLKQLSFTLSNHIDLYALDLSYNEIDSSSIPFIKKIISEHPKLEKVELSFNGKNNDDHIYALIRGNSKEFNERIKSIDFNLAFNFIKEDCLKEAKKFLSPVSRLTMLSGNFFKDQKLKETTRAEATKDLENTNPNSEILRFISKNANESRYPSRDKKPTSHLTYDHTGRQCEKNTLNQFS